MPLFWNSFSLPSRRIPLAYCDLLSRSDLVVKGRIVETDHGTYFNPPLYVYCLTANWDCFAGNAARNSPRRYLEAYPKGCRQYSAPCVQRRHPFLPGRHCVSSVFSELRSRPSGLNAGPSPIWVDSSTSFQGATI